jgi:hypothetical protein
LALGCLVAALVAVGWAFAIAVEDGRVPSRWWDTRGGNHGPWRHYEPVGTMIDWSFVGLVASMIGGLLTSARFRCTGAAAVAGMALLGLMAEVVFLFWLCD